MLAHSKKVWNTFQSTLEHDNNHCSLSGLNCCNERYFLYSIQENLEFELFLHRTHPSEKKILTKSNLPYLILKCCPQWKCQLAINMIFYCIQCILYIKPHAPPYNLMHKWFQLPRQHLTDNNITWPCERLAWKCCSTLPV